MKFKQFTSKEHLENAIFSEIYLIIRLTDDILKYELDDLLDIHAKEYGEEDIEYSRIFATIRRAVGTE